MPCRQRLRSGADLPTVTSREPDHDLCRCSDSVLQPVVICIGRVSVPCTTHMATQHTQARLHSMAAVHLHASCCITCMQREHKSAKQCASEVEECQALRRTFYACKRGQVDNTKRIRGIKGY